ncbi:MAG: PqqD family protein [Candidatus Nanopelagicales bacterium]
MSAPRRWRHAPEAVVAQVGEAWLILTPDFRYVEVDAVGGAIWHALTGGADAQSVGATLACEFEVDAGRAERDAEEFIGRLADLGAVEAAVE